MLLPWSLSDTPAEAPPDARAPVVVSCSAHDASGCVGLAADARTCVAVGAHLASVATSVSAQNTQRVLGALALPVEAVGRQWEAIHDDLEVDAIKTGRLAGAGLIRAVYEAVASGRPKAPGPERTPLVVDPVLTTHTGDALLGKASVQAYMELLVPLADVVTPNAFEAELLTGRRVGDRASMKDAGKALFDLGVPWVLVTSVLDDRHAVDLLYDGSGFVEFGADRVPDAEDVQGAGCVLSAAIAAHMARGASVPEAVERSKALISSALKTRLRVGQGGRAPHVLADLYRKAGAELHTLRPDPEDAGAG